MKRRAIERARAGRRFMPIVKPRNTISAQLAQPLKLQSTPSMPSKSVETLLEDIRLLSEERYETVQAVLATVRQAVKPLSEEVKYGGVMFTSGVSFGGVFAYKEHVSVEFTHGARIVDELGVLEGHGKARRHLKLASPSEVQSKHLGKYLLLALDAAQSAA